MTAEELAFEDGYGPLVKALRGAGLAVSAEDTGGGCIAIRVDDGRGNTIIVTVDETDDAAIAEDRLTFLACRYARGAWDAREIEDAETLISRGEVGDVVGRIRAAVLIHVCDPNPIECVTCHGDGRGQS